MALPQPDRGLLIQYEYVWYSQHKAGQETGVKPRPCLIVNDPAKQKDGPKTVYVLPLTTSPQTDKSKAVEVPPQIGKLLGLEKKGWVMTNEGRVFQWPDGLQKIDTGPKKGQFSYGYIPGGFQESVVKSVAGNVQQKQFKTAKDQSTDRDNPDYRKGRPAELRTSRAKQLAAKINARQGEKSFDQDKERDR